MFCRKCGSQLADDAMFCHKCGTPPVKIEEPAVSAPIPYTKIEDIAKYDIVLVDITTREDLSEKAHMAVAYVLFEDEIKRVSGGLEPDTQLKKQVQDEATRKAYEMARNLPTTLKRSVKKKEALFFKERLAGYGVTVLLGYCPNCGGALSNMSDRCSVCGQAAIELGDRVAKSAVASVEKPMLGETSSFCRKCGTLSQGEAAFCRKCGSQTGDPPAFATSEILKQTEPTHLVMNQNIKKIPVNNSDYQSGESVNIRSFIDERVRASTPFATANKLLTDAKPLSFVKIYVGIGALIGLILGILGVVNESSVLYLFAIPLCAFVGLGISAIPAKIRVQKIEKEYPLVFRIDTKKLVTFLNNELAYLSPHFSQWSVLYENKAGKLLRKTIKKLAKTDYESETIRCVFCKKAYLEIKFLYIKGSEATYEFSARKKKNIIHHIIEFLGDGETDEGWAAYRCLYMSVPILTAAMEYYLNNTQSNSKQCDYASAEGSNVPSQQQNDPIQSVRNNEIPKKRKSNRKLLISVASIALILIIALVLFLLTRGYSGDYPDEILFEDRPITRFIDMTRDDLRAEFGEPGSSPNGSEHYLDIGVREIFYNEQSGKIIYVSFFSYYCTLNGHPISGYLNNRDIDRLSASSPLPYLEKFHTQYNNSPHKTVYDPSTYGDDYYFLTFDDNNLYAIDFMVNTTNQGESIRSVILFSNEWGQTSPPVIEAPNIQQPPPQTDTLQPQEDEPTTPPETSQSNPSDSILRLDGISLDDVWQFDPESTSYILGEPLRSGDVRGSFEMEYQGFILSFDAGELRRIFIDDASQLSIGGVTLDMNQAGLLAALGVPSYDIGGAGGESYDIVYEMGYFVIQFIMISPDDVPIEIYIWLIY